MEVKIGNKTYDFNCKLKTTIKIRKKFKKNFNDVVQNITELNTEQLIDLLYCGLDESEIGYEEFLDDVLENVGYAELYEMIASFIKQIQYPGKTDKEIDKILEEKNQQAQAQGIL